MTTQNRFGLLGVSVAVTVAPFVVCAIGSGLAGCDRSGGAGPVTSASSGNGGATGLTGQGYTAPTPVTCTATSYCIGLNPPPCEKYSGCEPDNTGGAPGTGGGTSVCTYTPSKECIPSQVLTCQTHFISTGVMTCNGSTCKFDGPGACRRCGTMLGDPCCPGPSPCATGTCQTDLNHPQNMYTGSCQ
jgi:hypothetical protein